MAVETIKYAPTLAATGDTFRGPSAIVWKDIPVDTILQDQRQGVHFFDDFQISGYSGAMQTTLSGSMGQWSIYMGSNSGGIIDAGIVGGAVRFMPSSGTAAGGASTTQTTLSGIATTFQITSGSGGNSALNLGRLAFEARASLFSVTGSARDAFIGLADSTTPSSNYPFTVVSGGSSQMLSTTRNLIGFYNASSGRGQDWAFVFQLANTAPVFCTGMTSLISTVLGSAISANTYYKLGFVYDPLAPATLIGTAGTGQTVGTLARNMLRVYVNGIQCATFLTQAANILTASFPTGIMAPCLSFANVTTSGTTNSGSTVSGTLDVDWIKVAQLNQS